MMTASVMSTGLNFVILALTPIQRWQAAREFTTGFMSERWFIATCIAALIVLSVLFVLVTCYKAKKERETANRLFFEYADERGLNPRERHILMYIATRAKLKQKESIFTMADAFDRGATKIIRAALTLKGKDKRRRLNAELSILREKLGFKKRGSSSTEILMTNTTSSRQIPRDRKLYLTSLETGDFNNIESVVVENNDIEFIVELSKRFEVKKDVPLCIRYYFGASVWEFDTTVIDCEGDILILNHSDNVRFINRRRFLRVPTNEPAYIAAFPFAKTLPDKGESQANVNMAESFDNNWGPPEFIPAEVTELAGPGLRVKTPLKVKVGDRVVVILKLGDNQNYRLTQPAENTALHSTFFDNKKNKLSRIVEDIGIVRHTEAAEKGFSVAVELTGLNETNLSEMVRVTNAASMRTRFEIQSAPTEAKGDLEKENTLSEAVV
jgi:hypothetical protein